LSRLPSVIRLRTLQFLKQHAPQQHMLLHALSVGETYWPSRYP
jgi:hypothetical protein